MTSPQNMEPSQPDPALVKLQTRVAELEDLAGQQRAEIAALGFAARGFESREAMLKVDYRALAQLQSETQNDNDRLHQSNRSLTANLAALELALLSSREVGAAVNVLMERLNLTQEQAFVFLKETSQNTLTNLVKLAEGFLQTRDIE